MRKVVIQDRQTLFDIAVQYCGDREAAFQIANINDISLTETLPVGLSLEIPEVINQKVVNYYTNNSISPATASTEQADIPENAMISNDGQYQLITNNNNLFIIQN
jgi:hypothetical protein